MTLSCSADSNAYPFALAGLGHSHWAFPSDALVTPLFCDPVCRSSVAPLSTATEHFPASVDPFRNFQTALRQPCFGAAVLRACILRSRKPIPLLTDETAVTEQQQAESIRWRSDSASAGLPNPRLRIFFFLRDPADLNVQHSSGRPPNGPVAIQQKDPRPDLATVGRDAGLNVERPNEFGVPGIARSRPVGGASAPAARFAAAWPSPR
jgi:hypothetical protein